MVEAAAVAHDFDRHGLPGREKTDRYDEFVGVGNRAVADFDDYVILEDSGLFRGTAGFDIGRCAAPTQVQASAAAGGGSRVQSAVMQSTSSRLAVCRPAAAARRPSSAIGSGSVP
jgi:hypothetical protein